MERAAGMDDDEDEERFKGLVVGRRTVDGIGVA
jgi:hypothetical protein